MKGALLLSLTTRVLFAYVTLLQLSWIPIQTFIIKHFFHTDYEINDHEIMFVFRLELKI